jgi:hypothetical protein
VAALAKGLSAPDILRQHEYGHNHQGGYTRPRPVRRTSPFQRLWKLLTHVGTQNAKAPFCLSNSLPL